MFREEERPGSAHSNRTPEPTNPSAPVVLSPIARRSGSTGPGLVGVVDPWTARDVREPLCKLRTKGIGSTGQDRPLYTEFNLQNQIVILRAQIPGIVRYIHELNLTDSTSSRFSAKDIFTAHDGSVKTARPSIWGNIIASREPVVELANIEKLAIFAMSLM